MKEEDIINREWLKSAIHNFYSGLKHPASEDDIIACINAAPQLSLQDPHDDWLDIRSDEMTFEQSKHAVKDLRKKLAFYLIDYPKFCPKCGAKLNREEGNEK